MSKKNSITIKLTQHEISTGLNRLSHAENLIRQLKPSHKGRNNWLKLYGKSQEAKNLRENEYKNNRT